MVESNWAGNVRYMAKQIHQPESIDDLRRIVARAPKIRALGTRHSFNDIVDSAELVALDRLETLVELDRDAMMVTVGGGIRSGDLARVLMEHDLALHAMASLPHISVAGAITTATHGSGNACGNLATAVTGLEVVTSEGELLRVRRGDDDFAGMVVGLGALGVVTRVTLDVMPGYLVRQEVFQNLSWEMLFARFDEIVSETESVSIFTDYGEAVNQVWLKSHVEPENPTPLRESLLGAAAATGSLHPVGDFNADAVTEQLGIPGSWADRLPHFRLDATPSSGDEIQTEYFVGREGAVAALRAVRELGTVIRPLLYVSEIRTIASDDLWMSMAYGRDSVGIHFTWKPDEAAVRAVLPAIEEALAPFDARPHWGKVFSIGAEELERRYPRMLEFRQLAARMDPREAFRNAWLARTIG